MWPFPKSKEDPKEVLKKKRDRLHDREDRATASFKDALQELDRAMAVVSAENDKS